MKYTLRELRARKRKTQKEVAYDMGVSVTTYNAWEKDLKNVAVGKVAGLCQYYGISLSEFAF